MTYPSVDKSKAIASRQIIAPQLQSIENAAQLKSILCGEILTNNARLLTIPQSILSFL